jgi:hypothetical protein
MAGVILLTFALLRRSLKKEGVALDVLPKKTKIISDFKIYNYLPTKSISMDVLPQNPDQITTGKPKELVAEVKPKSYSGLYYDQVLNDLKPGNVLRIYAFPPGKPEEKVEYSDYVLGTDKNERIKALHVGMITTRFVGDPQSFFSDLTHWGNAASGSTWLNIHNLTNIPLSLNEGKIHVPAHSVTRYLGINNRNDGVPLGMWFRDDGDMYPTYQHLQPYSDVYYGLTSDIQQAVNTYMWEVSPVFDWGKSEPAQTLWPFEAGVY